ncbi:phosphatase PAP2 family protein [Polaribacter sp. Hel_I_88]|uniref:phosphatase PAP2 family protein n=1 Tax=Polaribacter sp. Hel_I_88 TaxID=1250006 RepID=UPI00047B1F6E|nr:phosphatase PAP2 family protein [Polaribacter sp. Hel_I_88]
MFDSIIQKDKELSVFLNNLGSEQWDSFWLGITNQFYWAPLFLFILILVVKTFGWKRGGVMILAMILLVTISDQLTVFIKDNTFRLRPNNDPEIMNSLRTSLREFTNPQSHSFMSGHATTSTFFSLFTIFLLRERYKQIYFILIFPLFFAYSRLYLGVHFPSDVFVGILTGILLANIYYFFFKKLDKKLFL